MAKVAVVAHARKNFGGGLPELRQLLAREGVTDPLWYEAHKSRKAPKYPRRGGRGRRPDVHLGGDGTVQRCLDAVAGTDLRHMTPPSLSLREATAATPGTGPFHGRARLTASDCRYGRLFALRQGRDQNI